MFVDVHGKVRLAAMHVCEKRDVLRQAATLCGKPQRSAASRHNALLHLLAWSAALMIWLSTDLCDSALAQMSASSFTSYEIVCFFRQNYIGRFIHARSNFLQGLACVLVGELGTLSGQRVLHHGL